VAMTTRLYALGSNSSGQLGLGHFEDVNFPTSCRFILAPSPSGRGAEVASSNEMLRLGVTHELRSPIRKVAAGGNHTIVLCDNGAVYAAGNPEALGETVNLGLKETWPSGANAEDPAPYFKRVMWWDGNELLDTFIDVSATWSASFFVVAPEIQKGYVKRLGRIYGCGIGEKGELGLGKDAVQTIKPRRVAVFGSKDYPEHMGDEHEEVPLIPYILAGIWSSVADTVTCSTDEVHVYGWGACRKGQLGNSVRDEKVIWKPRKIPDEDIQQDGAIDRASMAAVGRDFTLLGGTYGKPGERLAQWRVLGGNGLLNTNRDDAKQLLAELTIPVSKGEVFSLQARPYASWSNFYILDNCTHKVKALGRNDRGQLPPKKLPEVRTMAAGSEHCVAFTFSGTVLVWGWGEHGNCGRECDKTGQGWSVLNLPLAGGEKVSGVGAGCATTFAWTAQR
jgi:protein ATS1